jgi:hypothetical protein
MPSVSRTRHARGGEPLPKTSGSLSIAQAWRRVARGLREGAEGRAALRRGLAPALALALFFALASPAGADVGATIISKCTHGESIAGFSQQAYREALQELPTEVEEYSDCANLIRQAELGAAGGGGGGAGGSFGGPASGRVTPIPLTPAESSAVNEARKAKAAPARVDGALVQAGVVPVSVASALSSLPTPLLAILAFMLACALVLAGGALRNRVRAKRSN